jgi:hypothetical protein
MPFFGSGGGSAASNMVGATSSAAGTAGLVPAPAAGDDDKFLAGDATFGVAPRYISPCLPNWLTGTFATRNEGNPYTSGAYGYVIGANRLGLCPVFIRKSGTYTVIGLNIQNDAAKTSTNIRFGIYNVSNSTLRPTTLISDSGDVTYTNNSTVSGTISAYLKSGFYWAALVTDGTHNLSGGNGLQANLQLSTHVVGFSASNPSNYYNQSVGQPYISHTFGALPSDISSSTISFNNDGSWPTIFLRI